MNQLLQFEKEKCRDPRRFPMYFRLKLDVCGIKLSKRDWNSFAPPEKEQLLAMPCETAEQIAAFRARLQAMIRACSGDSSEIAAAAEPGSLCFPWIDRAAMPEPVRQQVEAFSNGVACPDNWPCLSDLQRFALIKLTQPGKVKPALRLVLEEFAMLPKDNTAS